MGLGCYRRCCHRVGCCAGRHCVGRHCVGCYGAGGVGLRPRGQNQQHQENHDKTLSTQINCEVFHAFIVKAK